MLNKNIFYLNYSLKHPEHIWDKDFYPFLQKTIDKREYSNIVNLEDFIDRLSKKVLINDARKVIKLLAEKGCEKSYFSFFLRTCDLSVREMLEENFYSFEERAQAMCEVLTIYKRERNNPRTDKYSLQAYNDAQTAKRRSDTGEDKIIALSGLPLAINLDDIQGKIAKINKSKGNFSMKNIKHHFGIQFRLGKTDKVPDCVFKIGKEIFILEAKHVNGQGGAQNGSLRELVSILQLKENNPNIHYVAFLDGCYTKYLTLTTPKRDGNKLQKQSYRIEKAIFENSNNFFLNTSGFKKFISDLK